MGTREGGRRPEGGNKKPAFTSLGANLVFIPLGRFMAALVFTIPLPEPAHPYLRPAGTFPLHGSCPKARRQTGFLLPIAWLLQGGY